MKHLLTILAFLIIVCAPTNACAYYEDRVGEIPKVFAPHSIKLHGDTRFTSEERMEIGSAAEEWARFTAGRAHVEIAWDLDELRFLEAPLPILYRSEPTPETGNFGGNTKDGVVRLIPDTCRRFATLKACAMHEFGHLLGLEHFENVTGQVMSTCGSPPVRGCGPSGHFGSLDYRECLRVNVCAPRGVDVTTVTVTVDPAIPRIDPLPPGW